MAILFERTVRHTFCLAAVLLTGLSQSAALHGATIEEQFLQQAPRIVAHLRQQGYRNVGVLKFRVKKGNGPVSDSVGTVNTFLAHRLEVALVLASSHDPAQQVGLIRGASATASGIRGAGHTTAQGRQKLFEGRYQPAWGDANQTVTADAFVTGVVLVSADLREMRVGILAFDRKNGELQRIVPVFSADVDADLLNELGESFVLRGAFDGGDLSLVRTDADKQAVREAAAVKSQEQQHPLAEGTSPVELEVLYDGRAVGIEFRAGEARIPEPRAGQQVRLVLKRRSGAKGRLGVVLKVNGENTLYRERKRDIDCTKWILGSDARSIVIRGFQSSGTTTEAFRVLSQPESRENEVYYGADVGMISLAVFREQGSEESEPAVLPDETAEDLLALTRGVFPQQPASNLAVLQQRLRQPRQQTRGLIAQGDEVQNTIRTVQFKAAPVPVMSATIRYYTP